MPFKFFTVPIQDDGTAAVELNGFLRSHRVLSVDRRWVEQGAASFWSFCIDYLEPSSGGTGPGRAGPVPLVSRLASGWKFRRNQFVSFR